MRPARDFDDWSRLAHLFVEPVEAGIGIGLHRTRIGVQMLLGMDAGAVTRVEEQSGWRIGPAKRPVVADIGPQPTRSRFTLGQNRYRRVVGMDAVGREDMAFYACDERHQCRRCSTHPIGQGRHIEVDALAFVNRALPVERQVQAIF
jgi:hypothetical protein